MERIRIDLGSAAYDRLKSFGRRTLDAWRGEHPEAVIAIKYAQTLSRTHFNWSCLKALASQDRFLAEVYSQQTDSAVEICSNMRFWERLDGREDFAAIAVDEEGQPGLYFSRARGFHGDLSWFRVENSDDTIKHWLVDRVNLDLFEKFAKMTRMQLSNKLVERKFLQA